MRRISVMFAGAVVASLAAVATAAFAEGFFEEKAGNPIDREADSSLCRIELRYSPLDPTGVAIDMTSRNVATRCAQWMDQQALATAALRMAGAAPHNHRSP